VPDASFFKLLAVLLVGIWVGACPTGLPCHHYLDHTHPRPHFIVLRLLQPHCSVGADWSKSRSTYKWFLVTTAKINLLLSLRASSSMLGDGPKTLITVPRMRSGELALVLELARYQPQDHHPSVLRKLIFTAYIYILLWTKSRSKLTKDVLITTGSCRTRNRQDLEVVIIVNCVEILYTSPFVYYSHCDNCLFIHSFSQLVIHSYSSMQPAVRYFGHLSKFGTICTVSVSSWRQISLVKTANSCLILDTDVNSFDDPLSFCDQ
jgi:hypothetical protein